MHLGDPLVSVIMPVFNCAEFLPQAIESIQAQTYRHWELLIGDDCSVDESTDVIRTYAEVDKRIRYCSNSSNMGAAYTRNLLVKMAKGDYVALMDADDVCDQRRLEDQLNFLIKSQLDACGTNYYSFGKAGEIIEIYRNCSEYQNLLWSACTNFSFCNASLLVKRECLIRVGGYDARLRTQAEDVDLIFRLLLYGYKIETLDELYYGYRQHSENVSRRFGVQQQANSLEATRNLLYAVLNKQCSEDFVLFMKYYHRPDFVVKGDCADLLKNLRDLIEAVESKIILQRIDHPDVRLDMAKRMLFLSLNHRRKSTIVAFSLAIQAILFDPRIVGIVLRDKWKKLL